MHSVAKNLGRNIVEAEERKRLATNGHATYFWQGRLLESSRLLLIVIYGFINIFTLSTFFY